MRDFLLDTQTVRYWYDDKCAQHRAVIDNIESLKMQAKSFEHEPRLLVSVVTLGEIEFGHRVQAGGSATKQEQYMRFVREELPDMLDVTVDAVAVYGEIRSRLFNKCAPGDKRKPGMRPEQLTDPVTSLELQIQENDLWLCAQAAAHRMVLVTSDRMHAIRGASDGMDPGLMIQDWARPGEARIDVAVTGPDA